MTPAKLCKQYGVTLTELIAANWIHGAKLGAHGKGAPRADITAYQGCGV